MRYILFLLLFAVACDPSNKQQQPAGKPGNSDMPDKPSNSDMPNKPGKSDESSASKKNKPPKGATPESTELFTAVKGNDVAKVNQLLAQGVDVNARDESSYTPLRWAVLNGNKDIIKALLDKKANVNEKNANGETPLMLAVFLANPDAIDLLLAGGADVNAKSKDNFNALAIAGATGNNSIINKLIKGGADKDPEFMENLNTAHAFANSVDNSNVEKLLQGLGGGGRFRNEDKALKGANKLHLGAIFFDDPNLLNLLISQGADVSGKIEKSSGVLHSFLEKTPLFLALDFDHFPSAKLLVEKGAKVQEIAQGESLLEKAVKDYSYDALKFLVRNGVDLKREDYVYRKGFDEKKNANLLHISIENRNVAEDPRIVPLFTQFLIDHGVKIDGKNDKKETPLMLAVGKNCLYNDRNFEIIKVLVKNSANVKEKFKDVYGYGNIQYDDCSILASCIAQRNWPYVEVILQSQSADRKGQQCVDYANNKLTPLEVFNLQGADTSPEKTRVQNELMK